MQLPYRPLPRPDESLPGFSVRLATIYGFKNPDAFSRQVFGNSLPRFLPDKSVSMDKWLDSLENIYGCDPSSLSEHFVHLRQKYQCEDSRRIITDITIGSPRICEHCLSEIHYHRFEWQVAHRIVCDLHVSPILDSCPECQCSLKWDENILSGCKSCGYIWGSRGSNPQQWQGYLKAQQSVSDLDRLYRGYLHSAFSKGHSVWPKAQVPYDPKLHSQLMQSAYRLVCDPEWNQALSGKYHSLRPEGHFDNGLAETHALRIKKLASPIAAAHVSFGNDKPFLPDVPELVIPKKHQKHLKWVQAEDICESDTVAAVLGLSISQVNQLVSRDVIRCLSTSQILRDRVFNLGEVSDDISHLFGKATPNPAEKISGLTLDEADGIVQRYGFDLVDCIEWLHSGSLSFSLTDAPGCLAGIRVERETLINHCESSFMRRAADEELDRLTVMKMLGVPENVLDFLGKEGMLPSERWYGPGVRYEFSTIRDFLSRYCIARRESFIQGIPTSEIWKRLSPSKADVLLTELPGGHFVGIVKRDKLPVSEAA